VCVCVKVIIKEKEERRKLLTTQSQVSTQVSECEDSGKQSASSEGDKANFPRHLLPYQETELGETGPINQIQTERIGPIDLHQQDLITDRTIPQDLMHGRSGPADLVPQDFMHGRSGPADLVPQDLMHERSGPADLVPQDLMHGISGPADLVPQDLMHGISGPAGLVPQDLMHGRSGPVPQEPVSDRTGPLDQIQHSVAVSEDVRDINTQDELDMTFPSQHLSPPIIPESTVASEPAMFNTLPASATPPVSRPLTLNTPTEEQGTKRGNFFWSVATETKQLHNKKFRE